MKTLKFITVVVLAIFTLGISAQIKILSSGAVNLGNSTYSGGILTADYTGYYYNGTNIGGLVLYPTASNTWLGKPGKGFSIVYTYSTQNPSDARLKENLKDITGALSIIKKLKGVQFDYKAELFSNSKANPTAQETAMQDKARKNYLGFLAQDVQKVLPQIVFHDDSTDLYSVDYTKLIPVLVEAIKEQQVKIDELTAKINAKNSNLKSAKDATDVNTTEALIPYLAQNSPNPFNASTSIKYYLSGNTKNAMLNIYDMNGGQLKSISITQYGEGAITIQASELTPGMYLYSLIADGIEVDTKRMILTK